MPPSNASWSMRARISRSVSLRVVRSRLISYWSVMPYFAQVALSVGVRLGEVGIPKPAAGPPSRDGARIAVTSFGQRVDELAVQRLIRGFIHSLNIEPGWQPSRAPVGIVTGDELITHYVEQGDIAPEMTLRPITSAQP